jgi:hypothetical protein
LKGTFGEVAELKERHARRVLHRPFPAEPFVEGPASFEIGDTERHEAEVSVRAFSRRAERRLRQAPAGGVIADATGSGILVHKLPDLRAVGADVWNAKCLHEIRRQMGQKIEASHARAILRAGPIERAGKVAQDAGDDVPERDVIRRPAYAEAADAISVFDVDPSQTGPLIEPELPCSITIDFIVGGETAS